MPNCLKVVKLAGPDGEVFSLVLDLQTTDLSTCAYVVSTGAEVQASPFLLTVEDGGLISAALVSVWAAAFGIRAIIQIVKGSSE